MRLLCARSPDPLGPPSGRTTKPPASTGRGGLVRWSGRLGEPIGAAWEDLAVTWRDGGHDPLEILDRRELDDDLALLLPEVDLDPGLEPIGKPRCELGQGR